MSSNKNTILRFLNSENFLANRSSLFLGLEFIREMIANKLNYEMSISRIDKEVAFAYQIYSVPIKLNKATEGDYYLEPDLSYKHQHKFKDTHLFRRLKIAINKLIEVFGISKFDCNEIALLVLKIKLLNNLVK